MFPNYIIAVLLPFLVSCVEEIVFDSEISTTNNSLPSTNVTNNTQAPRAHPPFGILNTLSDYSEWASKEIEIVSLLQNRLDLIETEIDLIDNYLEDYQESTGEAMLHLKDPKNTPEERGRVVGSSTVLGHRMTSRYVGVVSNLRKLLTSSEYQDNLLNITQQFGVEEISNSSNSTSWPGRIELFMSMKSLIHIQETYGYLPDQIYQGFNFENKSGIQMSPTHCVEMGVFALYNKHYYASVEWLQFVVNQTKSDIDNIESSLPTDLIEYLLAISIQEHNRILNKPELKRDGELQLNLYTHPIPQERIAKRKALFLKWRGLGSDTDPEAQFIDLCRGNISQTPAMQKNLKCFYEKSRHPYLLINPVKVEHLSESPIIFQFYEIITEEEAQYFRGNMSGKLKASLVYGDGDSIEYLTKYRTSVGGGVPQAVTPEKVFRLADMVTGLNVWDGVERIQYAEYTYGRFYTYHTDALADVTDDAEVVEELEERGDRLATILYYLEVADEGGLTPFCEAGVTARAERRSAVFWYNLNRNGTARTDVNHGACPVIQGHKIIMNHWIRHHSNWKHFKCSLNQYE